MCAYASMLGWKSLVAIPLLKIDGTFLVKVDWLLFMAMQAIEFSKGDTKLERFLLNNQHTQRKLLNFENWVSGEVSKIGHHFSK
mgnify:CR=1 FL=1